MFSKVDWWCYKVGDYLREHFKTVKFIKGEWGDHFPTNIAFHEVDYIISYLYPCIIPKIVLDSAREYAINFHPAPPKYPGIGGYNYAIWNGDKTYGVTCHEMEEKVDSGQIYNVQTFSLMGDESVKELKERSMKCLYILFECIINDLIQDGRIYQTVEDEDTKWHTPPYTREDFQKACEIDILDFIDIMEYGGMVKFNPKHLERKIRAFYFPRARDYPYFLINGKKYKVIPVEDEK